MKTVRLAKEFLSGETFHYLGRQYRLKLVPDETAVTTLSDALLRHPQSHGLCYTHPKRPVKKATRRTHSIQQCAQAFQAAIYLI